MQSTLFVDVDGYAAPGVSQARLVALGADGFRPRELGWVRAGGGEPLMTGAVYFYDAPGTPPLDARAPSIRHAHRVCRLPVAPPRAAFGGRARPSVEALDALRELLRDTRPQRVVHKGGHEGAWVRQVAPAVEVVDLNALGCPRLAAPMAAALTHCERAVLAACAFHEGGAAAGDVLHCPRYECGLMLAWLREHERAA